MDHQEEYQNYHHDLFPNNQHLLNKTVYLQDNEQVLPVLNRKKFLNLHQHNWLFDGKNNTGVLGLSL